MYQRYHGGKKTDIIRDRIVREGDDANTNTYIKQDEYIHGRYNSGEYDENRGTKATNKHTGNVSP